MQKVNIGEILNILHVAKKSIKDQYFQYRFERNKITGDFGHG